MGDIPSQNQEAGAWKQFWTGRADGQEHQFRDDRAASVLHGHWGRVLDDAFSGKTQISLIDLACGEGEVLGLAGLAAQKASGLAVHAVAADIAKDAVGLASSRQTAFIPHALVADSASLPIADMSFDLVLSQYGLEYAGPEAVLEAGRIVAPGGRLHALLHCAGGAVAQSCQPIATFLEQVIRSGLLERLDDFVITIPRAMAGTVSRETGQACAESLREAVEAAAQAAGPAAPGPARDHVVRLIQDCQSVASRLGAYRTEDLQAWITAQSVELEAFHHRMTSMLRVALNHDEIQRVAGQLSALGLSVANVETLALEAGAPPLAWIVDARREA